MSIGPVREQIPELVTQDSCDDNCPAIADVIAEMPSGLDLSFCQHHIRGRLRELLDQGALIYKLGSTR